MGYIIIIKSESGKVYGLNDEEGNLKTFNTEKQANAFAKEKIASPPNKFKVLKDFK